VFLTDDSDNLNDNIPGPLDHDHEASAVAAAAIDTPSTRRDSIAQAMWDDYLAILQQRDIGNEDSDSELGDGSMAEDSE
jgi:hypothetical protein